MLGYLSLYIIYSEKPTIFRKRSSRKTVRFSEQIMYKDKYPSIIILAPNGGYCLLIILTQLSLQYIYLHNLEYNTIHYLQILVMIPFIVFDTLQYSNSYFTVFSMLIQLLYAIYNTNTTTLYYLQYVYSNFTFFKIPIRLHYTICKTEHFLTKLYNNYSMSPRWI